VKVTQATLKKIIQEEIAKLSAEPTLEEAAEEAASSMGPFLAMVGPVLYYYLYRYFAGLNKPDSPQPPRRRIREGAEMPAIPDEALALLPDFSEDMQEKDYTRLIDAEIMRALMANPPEGLNPKDLRGFSSYMSRLIAAKKAQG
tara:strand:- start:895 stop:1326 length:432 start_codon:yes stop_codon:yes gene_type:complete